MSDTQPIFGFIHGAVLRRDRIYLAGVALEFEDQDVPHAILFERDDAAWNHWSFEHRLAGIACYRHDGVDTLLTVGQDGFVEAVDAEGADEERVAADDEWPSRQRPLYCVRLIDGVVHAAGGGRQVHRRAIDAHRWNAAISAAEWNSAAAMQEASTTSMDATRPICSQSARSRLAGCALAQRRRPLDPHRRADRRFA